jgi:hypothetical protein
MSRASKNEQVALQGELAFERSAGRAAPLGDRPVGPDRIELKRGSHNLPLAPGNAAAPVHLPTSSSRQKLSPGGVPPSDIIRRALRLHLYCLRKGVELLLFPDHATAEREETLPMKFSAITLMLAGGGPVLEHPCMSVILTSHWPRPSFRPGPNDANCASSFSAPIR